MAREKIIAGNWKMHKTEEETIEFIKKLASLLKKAKVSVYLAVPFTSIGAAAKAAKKTAIVIGAQNMHDADKGAFTGEIAGSMIKSAGAQFAILGHSERRHIFNETDAFINKKVLKALKLQLRPILCVGETQEERDAGQTEEVLARQIKEGLKGVKEEDLESVVIAYEPVWAIGTGLTATPEMAQKTHAFIRAGIASLFSKEAAAKMPILYGGSVKPDNIAGLMGKKDIDGALVGGAALEVDSFYKLVSNG